MTELTSEISESSACSRGAGIVADLLIVVELLALLFASESAVGGLTSVGATWAGCFDSISVRGDEVDRALCGEVADLGDIGGEVGGVAFGVVAPLALLFSRSFILALMLLRSAVGEGCGSGVLEPVLDSLGDGMVGAERLRLAFVSGPMLPRELPTPLLALMFFLWW